MRSFIKSFARISECDVTLVCLDVIPPERIKMYAGDDLASFCKIVQCNAEIKGNEQIEQLLSDSLDEIHIFGGMLGRVGEVLSEYNRMGGRRGVVITEKPSLVPTKRFRRSIMLIKSIRSKRIYYNAYKKNAEAIAGIFVTGQAGVRQLARYGIPNNKLFRFMYTHIDECLAESMQSKADTVRFLYLGRFEYLNRGVDSLVYAFERINRSSWRLDLVGGYGEDAEEIIKWAEKTPNVNYLGAWNNDKVIENMQNYDVCVSPTRMDGWRIQVNQAIMAGIATITTNEAISDELVTASGTGLVVDANSKKGLLAAVRYAVDHPQTVKNWKENTQKFKQKISNSAVAEYFEDTLEYLFEEGKEQPECPWAR